MATASAAAVAAAAALGQVADQPHVRFGLATLLCALGAACISQRDAVVISQRRQPETGQFWSEFGRELDRSRRHERPLVIMRLPVSAPTHWTGEDARDLTQRVRVGVRSSDETCLDGNALLVLLSETDRSAAEIVAARLVSTTPDLLAGSVRAIAAFPEDGLTTGALLKALSTVALREREPDRCELAEPGAVPSLVVAFEEFGSG